MFLLFNNYCFSFHKLPVVCLLSLDGGTKEGVLLRWGAFKTFKFDRKASGERGLKRRGT